MSLLSIWNGKLVEEEGISISVNNRSFRYGEGCFETMKVVNGNVLLAPFHFKRLLTSLKTLQFSIPAFFNETLIESKIKELAKVNKHDALARVRLVVYGGNGSLYDNDNDCFNYVIQSLPGKIETNSFNSVGLNIGIFYDAKISADLFSSIKSNNYLPSLMGAKFALQNKLDDCILLNAFDRVADSTIANVFMVTNGIIKTPPLTEGCISGVMREYLLNSFQKEHIPFKEVQILEKELLNASEIFLTNAIVGIRWVKSFGQRNFKNDTSAFLYNKFIAPLFNPATF